MKTALEVEALLHELNDRSADDLGYLDRGGSGKGSYWVLRSAVHVRIAAPGDSARDWRTDREAAKTRVLSILKQRARHREPGLGNKEIRSITLLGRNQVWRLMQELQEEEPSVVSKGHRAGTVCLWQDPA